MTDIESPVDLANELINTPDAVRRWDANAHHRLEELRNHGDPAYDALVALIRAVLADHHIVPPAHLLDIGSGLGFLSAALTVEGYHVTALDPSVESVAIAREEHGAVLPPDRFNIATLQSFAATHSDRTYPALVANMTMHAVEHLQTFMNSARRLLATDGVLITTVPNPTTYLQSRTDLDLSDVDLTVPRELSLPFRIHGHVPHPELVRYFHYPLRVYSYTARAAGLYISDFNIPDQVGQGRKRDIAVMVFEAWDDND